MNTSNVDFQKHWTTNGSPSVVQIDWTEEKLLELWNRRREAEDKKMPWLQFVDVSPENQTLHTEYYTVCAWGTDYHYYHFSRPTTQVHH